MIVYLGILILLCLWGVKFSGFREDYISKEQTGAFKGLFIMVIFLAHIRGYISTEFWGDEIVSAFYGVLGQLIVVVFLFYSGYGVMESVKNKPGYMKGFFKNRILKLLLDYNIVTLVYFAIRFATKAKLEWKHFAFSWCGWETVEKMDSHGNWFMFGILALYAVTWLTALTLEGIFRMNGKKYQITLTAAVAVLSVALMIALSFAGRGEFWYEILFVYSFGMFYSLCRKPVEKAMRKLGWYLLALVAITAGLGVIILLGRYNMLIYSVRACLFAALVVLVSMRVRIWNPVLNWLGTVSFSVFLVHKGSMAICQNLGFNRNPIVFGAVCIAGTMVLTVAHHWVAGRLSRLLLKKQKV